MGSSSRGGRRRRQRALWIALAVYLLVLAAALVLLFPLGDRVWPSTLLLLGPRWVLALPWPALAVATAAFDRRRLWLVAATGLVLAGPVIGFCVPLRLPVPTSQAGDIRVMTVNVGGGFDREAFASALESELPDVVALQEVGESIRAVVPTLPGWHRSEQYTSCLLSRFPIVYAEARGPEDDIWKIGGSGVIVRHGLATPGGVVHLVNVHLETPREGLEEFLVDPRRGIWLLTEKNAQRDIEAQLARRWVDQSPGPARLVTGDFNMTVESDIYRTHWSGFSNAFSVSGFGLGHTKHTRRIGVRIDHVLASPGWACVRAWVGPAVGSDHLPLIALVRWTGPSSS